VRIEIEYFIALCRYKIPQLSDFDYAIFETLRDIYRNFTVEQAKEVKDFEKQTNHDVKAVEYFIKKEFDSLHLEKYKEFIHFGLTSQDINNTAVPLSYKEAVQKEYYPLLGRVSDKLISLSEEWKDIPMLARTHGQPASPTRLGKELKVFAERLQTQSGQLRLIPFSAKFGGATGNFNAHHVAYPAIDWHEFGNAFVDNVLGLERLQTTTQIEHYDNLAASFDTISRINTILIDLCRDLWTYISMEYFKQKIKAGEVGSSAMPHKVNPIDFENAEGNFGIANSIFSHLSAKLPISRLQRDLTDSTVLRNIGVPLAHTFIGLKSLEKGLGKLLLNQEKIEQDLEDNWLVVSEAIQTILRREGYPKPYEALRDLTRTNEKIGYHEIARFVDSLSISDAVKNELKQITPFNYTGI
jgi:adenylosuccinate lyase